jgi:hypothetical protein
VGRRGRRYTRRRGWPRARPHPILPACRVLGRLGQRPGRRRLWRAAGIIVPACDRCSSRSRSTVCEPSRRPLVGSVVGKDRPNTTTSDHFGRRDVAWLCRVTPGCGVPREPYKQGVAGSSPEPPMRKRLLSGLFRFLNRQRLDRDRAITKSVASRRTSNATRPLRWKPADASGRRGDDPTRSACSAGRHEVIARHPALRRDELVVVAGTRRVRGDVVLAVAARLTTIEEVRRARPNPLRLSDRHPFERQVRARRP